MKSGGDCLAGGEKPGVALDLEVAEMATNRRVSEFSIIFRQFKRNRGAIIGLCMLVLFVLCGIFAEFLAPFDPLELGSDLLAEPSSKHLMGTDPMGRDMLSRILFGARISLTVGFIAVGIAILVGTTIGMIGGYFGGRADAIVVMFLDVMLAFPGLLLALTIAATLGPSLRNVMIAVGIGNVPTFARVIRSSALVEKEREYVIAAKVIGCGHGRIIVRHIFPNSIASLIVLATLNIGWAILSAASLSFLGLGAQPPTPEWGNMASTGREYLHRAPWLIGFPGLAIMITVLAANLLGDGLRDALDPRLRM